MASIDQSIFTALKMVELIDAVDRKSVPTGMCIDEFAAACLPDDFVESWVGKREKFLEMWMGQVQFMYPWAKSGFQRVQVTPAFASALMCTTYEKTMGLDIKPPWDAFVIEVPQGLLPFGNAWVTHIHVAKLDSNLSGSKILGAGWVIQALTSSGHYLSELAQHFAAFFDTNPDMKVGPGREDGDERFRLTLLCTRLIAGITTALTERAFYKAVDVKMSPREAGQARRMSLVPRSHLYRFTRPVKVDLRNEVRSFILSGNLKKPLSVQILVVGHWKRQVHGTGREQRKWIFVEPYWRGPEDMPIAVRPHAITNDAPVG